MRRLALAAVVATATLASPARATHDRTDRIPATVGPADSRSYYVNTRNLPAGVTQARWLDVAQRSLARWGATYLGPTVTASPDDGADGLNVIGFSASAKLAGSVVGVNTKSKGGTLVTPGRRESCEVSANMGTTQSVGTASSVIRLRLRSDRVRKRRVRRRTVTRMRTVTAPRIDSAPVSGQRCAVVEPGTESDPASVFDESDVLLDVGTSWFAGPGVPPSDRLDLESVLLHELGHAAGLAHQPQNCDPSSPMRPSGGAGDYWRGLEPGEYRYAACASYPLTPDAPHAAEAPFPGGSLGGREFLVNPAVPDGYDSDRFQALVRQAVERWGGVLAGTTTEPPTQGDGLNVIGFDAIARPQFEVTNLTTTERLVFPAYRTCAIVPGQVTGYRVKKVTRKVRVRGRRKKLRLRRDRIFRTSVSGPAGGQCADRAAATRPGTTALESDVGIAHEIDAYELGPSPLHPILLTKVDMATLLAAALGQAAGVAPAPCGSTDTPVTAAVLPGDWWHAPDDVNRVPCAAPTRTARATGAGTPKPASGRVRYVLEQN